ncbi:MAG: hypothetical protein SVG88_14910 [Halobacteriales archaeon]|nr:hypothetical protein [Halobacteriales archaeon]
MTFATLIDRVRDAGDVLELPAEADTDAATAEAVAELREYFETHNVEVRTIEESDGSDDTTVALYRGGELIATDPLESVLEYIVGETEHTDLVEDDVPAVVAEAETEIVGLTNTSRRRMLAGSRQIEKRAWRSRKGTIHAGFQRLSVFAEHEPTERLYRQLARSGVEVHIYGAPDVSIETEPGLNVHGTAIDPVTSTWFLAYTTATGPQAALLAQERRADRYTGFWTFAPRLAGDVLSAIESDLLTTA